MTKSSSSKSNGLGPPSRPAPRRSVWRKIFCVADNHADEPRKSVDTVSTDEAKDHLYLRGDNTPPVPTPAAKVATKPAPKPAAKATPASSSYAGGSTTRSDTTTVTATTIVPAITVDSAPAPCPTEPRIEAPTVPHCSSSTGHMSAPSHSYTPSYSYSGGGSSYSGGGGSSDFGGGGGGCSDSGGGGSSSW
ncbi:hypothetical protein Q8F55_006376 [Vanrija albida]|uniref:Uncharacterized protein n=1 Tax=Vanrija albida TaxID=181172 RepID=A0ABR3PX08_9TREE